MSFTTNVKNELTTLEFSRDENITELAAFVRNNHLEKKEMISLLTENPKVARRIYALFKNIYDVNPLIEQRKGVSFNKKNFYYIDINEKVSEIKKDLLLDEKVPKNYLIDSPELKRAYLRGVFLASGSINDPKTSRYHLEFLIDNKKEASFISDILIFFGLNNKIIAREKGYMLYIKEASKIGDFLRLISATNALLYYEDIRIYRDHKNMTNRLNNCEQANVDKTINSSLEQIKAIDKIINTLGIDSIDEKLKEVMIYRKKYPETSLVDLSYIISVETGKQITKSGLNHRMRKIKELSKKLEENEKNKES